MAYAKNTKVSSDRTIGQIRTVLTKAGASSFIYGEQDNVAMIGFQYKNRAVKMRVKFDILSTDKKTEQAYKSKYRSLLLCLKAKIESVESGIETFEQAFLPHIVLKNGDLIGDRIIPEINTNSFDAPKLLSF